MQNAFVRFLKARKGSHGSPRYPRKPLDEMLEFLRFTKVEPYIPQAATLLDIGAGDGNFLRYIDGHLREAVGVDSHLKQTVEFKTYRLVPGVFPYDFKAESAFDVITMMAVAEHIPMEVFPDVTQACWKYLKPGGQVIITVQHPRVEGLLDLLKDLRVVEGFSMHEHYGFDPECLPEIFNRWTLKERKRWGFRCNN
ncbi:class I SAM-dependent methyltransferase, partial [Candidatus Poribacteria bacterium]|nr:class I SAM-dependent methyltransferase [Candidatus Poribacteria bacterium]